MSEKTQPPASREELCSACFGSGHVVTNTTFTFNNTSSYVMPSNPVVSHCLSCKGAGKVTREVPPRCGAHQWVNGFIVGNCDLPKGHEGAHRVEWGGT